MMPDGSTIELYMALSGSWTILLTQDGVSCVKADGLDWSIPTNVVLPLPAPGIET